MTDDLKLFADAASFREWLSASADGEGVWLLIYKRKGRSISAANALEEALCFGWIDGQMESIDEERYKKYFSPRRKGSKWSDKNRALAERLIAEGRMTPRGLASIEDAKARGAYIGEARAGVSSEQIEALRAALLSETALTNYDNMPPAARKAYAGDYNSAKTEAGRLKKLARITERLEMNLNPMESMAKKKAQMDPQ